MSHVQLLAERVVSGRRLGRHIEHDERSREFAVAEPTGLLACRKIKSVAWTRRVPIFDQGDLGSCTGNAMAGAIATDARGWKGRTGIDETYAVKLYEVATTLDDVPGAYPPDDTGSSGLAVAKAAQRDGWVKQYRHAFSLKAALAALQTGPVIVGMSWLDGCDEPDENGLVRYTGYPRGGHEICAVAVHAKAKAVTFANSWGDSWGASGYFHMSWSDFGQALRQGGDVTVPVFV